MNYSKQDNPDVLRHIKDDSIHPRVTTGVNMLPTATQYQTLAKGASLWESTSILETRADGSYIKASSGDTLLKLRDINDAYSAYHYKYDTDNAYVIKNEADVDFSDIVLYCRFNTDLSDLSQYAHARSSEDATISNSIYKFGGGSALFVNAGGIPSDHIRYTQQTNEFRLGTLDFGISMWLKPVSVKNGDNFILINGWASTGLGYMYGIKIYGPNTLYFYSNSGTYHCTWTPSLTDWTHVEFDRNGLDAYIFINGVSQVVTIDTPLGDIVASGDIDIGAGQLDLVGYSYYGFNGYIEEVYFKIEDYLHIEDFTPQVAEFANPTTGTDNEIIRTEVSAESSYSQDIYIGSPGMRIIFLGDVIGYEGGAISLRHTDLNNLGWADCGHTTPIPLAYGGTEKALTASNGGIVYTDADSMEILSGTATAQKLLMSQSNVAPIWSTPTYPNSATLNRILRGDGTNVVLSTFTIPDTFLINTIPYASAANEISFGTTLPTHTVTTQLTTLKIEGGVASGGNLTLSTTSHGTKGKIYFGTASVYDQVNDRLGIGATSPDNTANFVKNENALTSVVIGNTNTGTSARSSITLTQDIGTYTIQTFFGLHNTAFNAGLGYELLTGSRSILVGIGTTQGMSILTSNNTPIVIGVNGYATANEIARFTTTGLTMYLALKTLYRDTAIHIASLDDGHLDLTADISIDINGLMLTQDVQPITDDTYYLGKNDDDSPLAWKGVILKDTNNGKYYRIEVINGVITPTDLTD